MGKIRRPPKMPPPGKSVLETGPGTTYARQAKLIAKQRVTNAAYNKMHAEGQAASKRARARAASGGGGVHRDRKGRFA